MMFLLLSDPPSSRPTRAERVAEHFVSPSFCFAGGTTEGVDRGPDLHVDDPGLFEHLLPARTGQPTCDSAGPQINVAQRFGWHGPAVGDIGELQDAAGSQHAADLVERRALVRTKVDDAVGD